MLAAVFVVLAFLLHWVAELERGLLRGEENAGSEFILHQLRHAIRAQGQPVTRIGDAARLFFAPVEPTQAAASRACRWSRSGIG